MPADDERDPVEAVAAEFAERLRRGERPDPAEYLRRHPDIAGELADLLPTVAALEAARPVAAPPPRMLGEFRVLRELGRGGMGVIYLGEQPSLGRQVAIKVLPPSVIPDARARIRFLREARIAANLAHPAIIPIHAIGEEQGQPWFAMHLVEGVGLDRIIAALAEGADPDPGGRGLGGLVRHLQAGGHVPRTMGGPHHTMAAYREAARILVQAAEALQYAHGRGVLHRDIKPANLLLDGDGRLWMADFGLAKALGDEDITLTNQITGTLLYLAPERFEGQTTALSDLYSLGLVLFELVTWKPAFDVPSRGQLVNAILNSGIPAPSSSDPCIPAALAQIVQQACARNPSDRYADAAALAADLRAFSLDRRLPSTLRRPQLAGGGWWRMAAVAVAALLLLLLGIAIHAWMTRGTAASAPPPVVAPQPSEPEPAAPAATEGDDPGIFQEPEPLPASRPGQEDARDDLRPHPPRRDEPMPRPGDDRRPPPPWPPPWRPDRAPPPDQRPPRPPP